MSELEPRHPSKKQVAPKHVPQLVVPVPVQEIQELVRDAARDTTLTTILGRVYAGWMASGMRLRVTPIDGESARIEIEVASNGRLLDTLLYQQNRSMVDRLFVAIQDELDRRARWRPAHPPKPLEE